MNEMVTQTTRRLALELQPGPGYSARLQHVLAVAAQEPGVRDDICTCSKCDAIGRPQWARLGRPDPSELPPLPLGWEAGKRNRNGSYRQDDLICGDCLMELLTTALDYLRKHPLVLDESAAERDDR